MCDSICLLVQVRTGPIDKSSKFLFLLVFLFYQESQKVTNFHEQITMTVQNIFDQNIFNQNSYKHHYQKSVQHYLDHKHLALIFYNLKPASSNFTLPLVNLLSFSPTWLLPVNCIFLNIQFTF